MSTEDYIKVKVTFFHRRQQEGYYSMERLFDDIRHTLPGGFESKVAISRFRSRGLWGRIYNIVEAVFRQGDVNHITGDVHFLTYLLRGDRTILTIHDLVTVHRLHGWRKSIFFFFWYWLPIKRAAVITVISESTKEDLLQHIKIKPGKLRIVYDCVSDVFIPDLRKFNAEKPVVLQIGTGLNKNVERVVRALQGFPCHFRVVGKLNDDQLATLSQCGVEYSFVYDISDVEIIEEYRHCDILVFASTYEGFGMPIIEAQATGRPVVTSNIMSMPEVAGEAASLVDPFNVAAIREAIIKITEETSYREELVKKGFKNVGRFRSQKIAKEYADIYLSLHHLRDR
jgi:glycosyltransferase involved in cell wall biosynthesis